MGIVILFSLPLCMFKNIHEKFSKMRCFILILTRISKSEPYSCQGEEIIIANTYLTLGMCQAVLKAIIYHLL